jgi:ubiquinone/menaquinone biosynthesis C-methylase UbiE
MYSPKEYWSNLADHGNPTDDAGFAPILHPLAPPWFNRLTDNLQFRAVKRALAIAEVPYGARILDVGCGTGRWVRRYKELGFSSVGVDATFGMLRIARTNKTTDPLTVGMAQSLPFSDSAFDCLSDITVIQHISYDQQFKAIQEMVRVVRPGGRLIFMEVISGKDPSKAKDSHVFPREPKDWIKEVEKCGAVLVNWFGQEFLLADRLYVHMAQALYNRKRGLVHQVQSASYVGSAESSFTQRAYWKIRHFMVHVSFWMEPLTEKVCPASAATHGVFVFQKNI